MVCRKEKIILAIIFLLFSNFSISAQENKHEKKERSKSFNVDYGVKAGFNSSMFIIDKFKINGTTITELQNNYKLGYNVAMFARFNFKRHFIQIGPEFSIINSEIVFDKKASQHPDVQPDYATITSHIKSVNIPLVYGYNLVKEEPYALSIFGGPTFKYIWNEKSKITFENFSDLKISEKLSPYAINIIAGLSVKISYIFFDFSYEIGLSNISESINEGENIISEIILNRRHNTLSFSVGCTF